MRIEALDMLASWAQPDPRDRVINAHRPLPSRDKSDAMEALSPQIDGLMASEGAVREKSIQVASILGIQKIVPLLVQRVQDAQQSPTIRAASLMALSRLHRVKAVALSRDVKMLPATELLPAAMRVLAKFDAKASLPKFIEATQSRSMEVRQLGWDIVAKSDAAEALATITAGVQAYLDGTLPSDVHLNVLEAAEGRLDDNLQKILVEYRQTGAAADPLTPWMMSLQGGNESRGSKLFSEKTELSCIRCHKVDRAGGEVGPNLTVIGKEKDRRYLLESICLPNSQIAKGYETAVVANDSGQVFTGVVLTENDDFLELIENNGSQKRIAIVDIVARKKGNSPMPEDLVKFMTPRELRDLVAYLASLKVDPRAEAEERTKQKRSSNARAVRSAAIIVAPLHAAHHFNTVIGQETIGESKK